MTTDYQWPLNGLSSLNSKLYHLGQGQIDAFWPIKTHDQHLAPNFLRKASATKCFAPELLLITMDMCQPPLLLNQYRHPRASQALRSKVFSVSMCCQKVRRSTTQILLQRPSSAYCSIMHESIIFEMQPSASQQPTWMLETNLQHLYCETPL